MRTSFDCCPSWWWIKIKADWIVSLWFHKPFKKCFFMSNMPFCLYCGTVPLIESQTTHLISILTTSLVICCCHWFMELLEWNVFGWNDASDSCAHTEKKPLFTQLVTLVTVEWAFSLTAFSANGHFVKSPEGHNNVFQQIGNLMNSHLAYWISVHATEIVVPKTFIQPAGFSTNFDGILSLSFLVLGVVCWWIVYKSVWWECIQHFYFYFLLLIQ